MIVGGEGGGGGGGGGGGEGGVHSVLQKTFSSSFYIRPFRDANEF